MLALGVSAADRDVAPAEGFGQHIPKGYIYFAMGFSVFVEMVNLRLRRRVEPVHLKERYANDSEPHA